MRMVKVTQKRNHIRIILSEIISIFFILLFIYAAISKLTDFQKFKVQLGQSPLLAPVVKPVTWMVPGIEITIVILLIIKKTQLKGLFMSFGLMVMFTGYIITILNFSEYIPCSCGGILQNMSWKQHLLFNLIFVVLGCIGVLIYPQNEQRAIAIGGEAENLGKSRQ